MERGLVKRVRTFNRIVPERIGALGDRFLGRDRPMGESRLLWEIGPDGIFVRALRARLGLDSGYVSRVLRSLQRQGLVAVEASRDDARVRRVRLTDAGCAEYAEIDRRSDEVAWSFLEPLATVQRERLVAAMSDVERLLRASMVRFAIEDPRTADARWCIEQYFAELNARFEAGYDPSRDAADLDEFVPPTGAFMIARLRERPVGCGVLRFHAGAWAELKRLWVDSEVRGLGIGRRLLLELERHARQEGALTVRLDTNRVLDEAIQLYRNAGYREIPRFNDNPYAHHWFEKSL